MKQHAAAHRNSEVTVRRERGATEPHGGHRISKPDRQVPKIVRDATSDFIEKYGDALKKLEKF